MFVVYPDIPDPLSPMSIRSYFCVDKISIPNTHQLKMIMIYRLQFLCRTLNDEMIRGIYGKPTNKLVSQLNDLLVAKTKPVPLRPSDSRDIAKTR